MDLRSVSVVAVHLALAVIAGVLVVIDQRSHRLPDRIVLPTLAVLIVLVAADAALSTDSDPLVRAGVGMLALGGFYAALRLISRDGMGGGDVKLAAVIGLVLGWHGWAALMVGALAAFVLGALYAIILILIDDADGSTRIPFGPWMILGAAVGILIG